MIDKSYVLDATTKLPNVDAKDVEFVCKWTALTENNIASIYRRNTGGIKIGLNGASIYKIASSFEEAVAYLYAVTMTHEIAKIETISIPNVDMLAVLWLISWVQITGRYVDIHMTRKGLIFSSKRIVASSFTELATLLQISEVHNA